jgi:2-dehydropantoate 2-reductase
MVKDPVIAVLGAGSVGCYLGGRLVTGGAKIIFIGRPQIKDELKEYGLTLTDWRGYRAVVAPQKISVETDPAAMQKADIILVTVKCRDTEKAANEISAHAKPEAFVVSLQNGVRNRDILKMTLPNHTVLAGIVPFNILHQPGGRFHCGTEGELIIEKASDSEEALSESFRKAGIPVIFDERIKDLLWTKLLINLNNAINALAGVTLVQELRDPLYRKILALCISEGLRAMKRSGIKPARVGRADPALLAIVLRLPDWLFFRVAKAMLEIDEQARSSMWEDLERHRLTEIDDLNGEIVNLAKSHGLAAPVNEKIIALVKEAEKIGKGSPRMSARALWDAVH